VLLCIGAGPYPEPLSNRHQVLAAKRSHDSIDIWNLPLEDYALLSKFAGLRRIWLDSEEGTFATDEKLKALAELNFTNLFYINLNNCRLVSDNGIQALSNIRSLKELPLEGTAITDKACEVMTSRMSLTMIDIANCPGVTKMGLEKLAKSKTLESFEFSADSLTQEEVLALVGAFSNVTWCEIVDTQRNLDANAIKEKAAERKIHMMVRPTGALQEMRLYH